MIIVAQVGQKVSLRSEIPLVSRTMNSKEGDQAEIRKRRQLFAGRNFAARRVVTQHHVFGNLEIHQTRATKPETVGRMATLVQTDATTTVLANIRGDIDKLSTSDVAQ